MTPAWIHAEAWRPLKAPRTNIEGHRSRDEYLAVIAQFEVASAERYRPRGATTFCNIFAWDVTAAMGCEIPHWYDPATGAPTKMGQGVEMNANAMADWLEKHGAVQGWQRVAEAIARDQAQQGKPALAIWKNPGGIGHVAMISPGNGLETRIAQAGKTNFCNGTVAQGFGKLQPQFWIHA